MAKSFRLGDGSTVQLQSADFDRFTEWIQGGYHPVLFKCSNCSYSATARLSTGDLAYAQTGEAFIHCPKCRKETPLKIPGNAVEIKLEDLQETSKSREVTESEKRIRELEASGWWSHPSRGRVLSEPTERRVVGSCNDCQTPIYVDDTGTVYCEGCGA